MVQPVKDKMQMDRTTKNADADVIANDFVAILQTVDKGRLPGRLSQKLDQVIRAVRNTGLKGSVTLTLAVTPNHKDENGEVDRVDIEATVKQKVPESSIPDTIL